MKVYQISLKVFLMKDIRFEESLWKIGSFIDSSLSTVPEFLEFHEKNTFKNYCFCSMYPLESKEKIYKKNNIYTIILRTVDEKLADFFITKLANHYDSTMKGLTADIKIIPKRYIEKIYSITPVILKNDDGYWRNCLSLEQFEERLKVNLMKKYCNLIGEKCHEDFTLYTSIRFDNKKPISTEYKNNICLLGDKITLSIGSDKIAQDLAYMSLGTAISEMNSRGFGFVNYKFL